MKKFWYVLIVMFLMLGIVACTPEEPAESTPTVVDTTPPLFFGISDVVVDVGDTFDPMAGITALDDVDGTITSRIVITGTYDLNVAGIYELTYTVTDNAGNQTVATRKVIVREKPESELFITNGDFSEPLSGTWTHWAGEGGASSAQIVDGVLQYNITAAGSQWWSSQFSQPNLVIPQGKAFIFEFEARADIARPMVVKLENAQYFGFIDEVVYLTTEWQTFTLEFFMGDPTITNGKLIFGAGTMATRTPNNEVGALTTIYLDNIKFIEDEVGEDTMPPVITGAIDRSISIGEPFDPLQGITVSDNLDFTLTPEDIVIAGMVDNQVSGDYVLIYTLTDASGNQTEVTRTITVLEGVVPSTWLVVNGDFTEDQLAPLPQPAETGWGWHGAGVFTAKIQDGVAQINVTNLGTVPWGVQFYQQNRIIEQGRIYRVTFDARAEHARPIMVALEQGVTRRFDTIVDITTEWATYVVEFEHVLPGYTNGKFAFFLGLVGMESVPTTIFLDNVSVETISEIIDTQAPVLRGVEDYYILEGFDFDPLLGVSVFDNHDKMLTREDIVVTGFVDKDTVGQYELTYVIEDASGNEATYIRTIEVVAKEDMLPSTFVLVNPDFEVEQLTPYAQPATAGWGWHGGGTFTVEIKDGIMTKQVTNVGTVPHGTQFYQQNLILETQATYRVRFDAKVDLERSVRVSLEMGTTVQWFEVVQIGTEWATYEVIIRVPQFGFSNGKFGFFAGLVEPTSPATTFYLDNIEIELVGLPKDDIAPMILGASDISVERGLPFNPLLGVTVFDNVDKGLKPQDIVILGEVNTEIPGEYTLTYELTDRHGNTTELERVVVVTETGGGLPSSLNIINGEFNVNQTASAPAGTGWGWHGNGQWNIEIKDGMAVIETFETWTQFFGVQFYILNRTVLEGHTYKITFRAKADDARPIQLNLESGGARFSAYFDLDDEWTIYEYEYTHTTAGFSNGKFSFFMGNVHGLTHPTTVYIDYVRVERILEPSPDSTPPQIWNVHDTIWVKGNDFDPMMGVRVYDHVDKTLTVEDVTVTGVVNVDEVGTYDLVYELEDASGNIATYTRIVTVVEQDDAITSRIVFIDGDFSEEKAITNLDNNPGWTLKAGASAGTWDPHTFVDGALRINVTNVSTIPHSIQFFQRNAFVSEAGSTYLLTFSAKADLARDIRVSFEETATWQVLSFEIVELTTEWTTYQVMLHNRLNSNADVKIGFFLGLIESEYPERSQATAVYFDDVSIKLIGYFVDNVDPMIMTPDVTVNKDTTFNPLSGIKYGDFAKLPKLVITSETIGLVTFNEQTGLYVIDTSVAGIFELNYTVTDIYDNSKTSTRTLTIIDPT